MRWMPAPPPSRQGGEFAVMVLVSCAAGACATQAQRLPAAAACQWQHPHPCVRCLVTLVQIRLKEYGSELLEVADNGHGVSPDNYQACAACMLCPCVLLRGCHWLLPVLWRPAGGVPALALLLRGCVWAACMCGCQAAGCVQTGRSCRQLGCACNMLPCLVSHLPF